MIVSCATLACGMDAKHGARKFQFHRVALEARRRDLLVWLSVPADSTAKRTAMPIVVVIVIGVIANRETIGVEIQLPSEMTAPLDPIAKVARQPFPK